MRYHIEPARPTVLSRVLDLVYPPRCVACGAWGAWLCDACVASIPALEPPLCPRCGTPVAAGSGCAACRRGPPHADGLRSAAAHARPLREAVHALKYGGLRALAGPLAQILAQCWGAWARERRGAPAASDVLPVPLHAARVRRRGYNQSALLARALAERAGLAYREGWLTRVRDTPPQVGLSPLERWENVGGAFVCPRPAAVRGAEVLLVDDVMTTGATLEACARALREAGAARVWALTLTRAPGRRRAWHGSRVADVEANRREMA